MHARRAGRHQQPRYTRSPERYGSSRFLFEVEGSIGQDVVTAIRKSGFCLTRASRRRRTQQAPSSRQWPVRLALPNLVTRDDVSTPGRRLCSSTPGHANRRTACSSSFRGFRAEQFFKNLLFGRERSRRLALFGKPLTAATERKLSIQLNHAASVDDFGMLSNLDGVL